MSASSSFTRRTLLSLFLGCASALAAFGPGIAKANLIPLNPNCTVDQPKALAYTLNESPANEDDQQTFRCRMVDTAGNLRKVAAGFEGLYYFSEPGATP